MERGNHREEKTGHTLPALFLDSFRDLGMQSPRTFPAGFQKFRDGWVRRGRTLERDEDYCCLGGLEEFVFSTQ